MKVTGILGQMVLVKLKERLGLMTASEASAKAAHYEARMALEAQQHEREKCTDLYYDYALYADLLGA
jgi:hypothetical protein